MDEVASGSSEAQQRQMGRAPRRVLGVLVEKAFCTPEAYPLTVNSLVTGCNQKSNRDPVTNLEPHQVDETLLELQRRGLVHKVIPATGRTERWKHNLKEAWNLERAERAVLAELLLRGPQTEGELRGRASRMVEIATLDELHALLERLAQSGFVRRLSPEGRKRGVIWTHLLYMPDELARLEQRFLEEQQQLAAEEDAAVPAATGAAGERLHDRVTRLESELEELRGVVTELRERVEHLATAHQSLAGQIQVSDRT